MEHDWTVCETCPHHELCHGSKWNMNFIRPTPEPDGENPTLTDVHTCFTCGSRVITDYRRHSGERLLVPGECPRWDARAGSGIDCSGCEAEREDLRRNHPNAALRLEASKKMMDLLVGAITKTINEPKDELAERRQLHEISAAMVDADNPTHWLKDFLAEFPEAEGRAEALLGAVVGSLLNDTRIIPEWSKHQDWQHAMFVAMWAEASLFAVQRNEDPEAAAWEVWLTVSDNPPVRRACLHIPLPEREMLRRGWAKELRGYDSGQNE